MIEKGVCSGQGGQGMVLVGELIAKAALLEGLEASVYPSYGPEIRGGASHSSYVVSDKVINNPVVADFDVAIIMNNYSMDQFVCDKEWMEKREKLQGQGERTGDRRLKRRGVLIYDSALILPEEVPSREDLQTYALPASDMKVGKFPNMVMLGAYMQIKDRPKFETMEDMFQKTFTGEKKRFIEPNLKDLRAGIDYILKNY